MKPATSTPVVHLELHTPDLGRARAFYAELCGWRRERVEAGGGAYEALELGGSLGGGIVECGTARSVWLPYVEVTEIGGATERARSLGAAVLLEPREGPAGWRSVISSPAGGEIAFWQQKR
jgi:predicted enzyme related to lactoylglutathione lyase